VTHLVSRLIRWATGRARIEGATRSDLVDLTSAERRASSGVDHLARAIRGAIYDGLCEGLTVKQISDQIEVLWSTVIATDEIRRLLRAELKRMTRVPVRVLSPRDHGKMIELTILDDVAPIPAHLLKPEHTEAGDRESNRIECGVYARIEAQRRALARDFPGFAERFLAHSPVAEASEGVNSPPASPTEPTEQVWGPSPLRRALSWWRLLTGGRVKENWRVVVDVPIADVQEEDKDAAMLDICRAWASDIGVEVPEGTSIKILCNDEAGNIVAYPLRAAVEEPAPASGDEITDPDGKAPVLEDDDPAPE